MPNDRMSKPYLELRDMIPADHFRTVVSFGAPKAPREIPVRIQMKDPFQRSLSFRTPWSGVIYGYIRCTDRLLELLGAYGLGRIQQLMAALSDWDTRFTIVFENQSIERELSFFVSNEDVRDLLENCCRIPAQRKSANT